MAIYLVMYALDQVCTHGYMNTENFHWFYNAVHGHVASYVKTFSLDNFISFLEMQIIHIRAEVPGFYIGWIPYRLWCYCSCNLQAASMLVTCVCVYGDRFSPSLHFQCQVGSSGVWLGCGVITHSLGTVGQVVLRRRHIVPCRTSRSQRHFVFRDGSPCCCT